MEAASRRTFDRWAAPFDRSRLLRSMRAQTLRELGLQRLLEDAGLTVTSTQHRLARTYVLILARAAAGAR